MDYWFLCVGKIYDLINWRYSKWKIIWKMLSHQLEFYVDIAYCLGRSLKFVLFWKFAHWNYNLSNGQLKTGKVGQWQLLIKTSGF